MDEFNGFFFCPVCSMRAAVWQSDFDSEELGYSQSGVVHFYTCSNCGAEVEAAELEDSDEGN